MNRTSTQTLLVLVCIAPLVALGCGDDGGGPGDSGTPADTGTRSDGGDGGPVDCTTADDGTSCGGELLCIAGNCQPTSCGDGYVDEAGGEACDDGNGTEADGCEPSSCQFTCVEDSQCDDSDPCNGEETCSSRANRCQAGTEPTTATCTRSGGESGVCSGGFCVSPGCGNGAVDGDDECDDGANGDNTDGCRDDCQFTCDAETPCADGDACNGEEMCDLGTHTCSVPADLDCDDTDPCTADSCDATDGCVNELIDVDTDGYAPATCTTPGLLGGDCDDDDVASYPGAPELCNGTDNDCNGTPDNGTVDVMCQRDVDGDGYGNGSDIMVDCNCASLGATPGDYIAPHPSGDTDCDDTNPNVNPGVTIYSSNHYCPGGTSCTEATGSFDWNCSGAHEQQYRSIASEAGCTSRFGSTRCSGSGWTTSTVPACGKPDWFIIGTTNYRTCLYNFLFSSCRASYSQRTQSCR